MLDDVARVRDYAGDKNFALGKLHALPQMVFVFVPRICGFETVRAGMNLQHVGKNLVERGVVDAWPLIDTVTGMKADLLFRNPAKAFIDCFDEHGCTPMPGRSIA